MNLDDAESLICSCALMIAHILAENMNAKSGNLMEITLSAGKTVTHFIYSCMVKDNSEREREGRYLMLSIHSYSFRLSAKDLLYTSSHRQNNTYHSLCYTSCGVLAGMRMGLSQGTGQTTYRTMNKCSMTDLSLAPIWSGNNMY